MLYRLLWTLALLLTISCSVKEEKLSVQEKDDIGVLKDIIRQYLLPNQKLARGTAEVPRIPEHEYLAAFDKVRQSASAALKKIARDPADTNVIMFIDHATRNFLMEDGKTMFRGREAAPGNITIDQYVQSANLAAEAMTPELRNLLRSYRPAAKAIDEILRRNLRDDGTMSRP